jgi:hypothetical protein
MFLLLSFAWQSTALTILKENNSYNTYNFKIEIGNVKSGLFITLHWDIHKNILIIKMSAQFKQQRAITFLTNSLWYLWSSSLLVLQSPCFEWDPCCSIFCLLCNVFSSFSLVLSVYLFGKLLVSPSFSWRNYL